MMVKNMAGLTEEEMLKFGNHCQHVARVHKMALRHKVASEQDDDTIDDAMLALAYTLVGQDLHSSLDP